MLPPLVALAHLAVLWLLAGPMFRVVELPQPHLTILGLTGIALSRADRRQPSAAPSGSRDTPKREPPRKPAAASDARKPPPSPVPGAKPEPEPDLTAEAFEPDAEAAKAVLERAAAANLESGSVLEAQCAIPERLQQALTSDATVGAGLRLVPPQARSVANAILVWDGSWVDERGLGGPDAIGPLRSAIAAQVRSLPPKCRELDLAGPRFLVFPSGQGPTVVALGSGLWRWSDLIR